MTRRGYRFEPAADGTTVTESFEIITDMPWYFRVSDRLLMGVNNRGADLVDNMSATLKRLRSVPETPPFSVVKGSE
jgi:hypothetical protein